MTTNTRLFPLHRLAFAGLLFLSLGIGIPAFAQRDQEDILAEQENARRDKFTVPEGKPTTSEPQPAAEEPTSTPTPPASSTAAEQPKPEAPSTPSSAQPAGGKSAWDQAVEAGGKAVEQIKDRGTEMVVDHESGFVFNSIDAKNIRNGLEVIKTFKEATTDPKVLQGLNRLEQNIQSNDPKVRNAALDKVKGLQEMMQQQLNQTPTPPSTKPTTKPEAPTAKPETPSSKPKPTAQPPATPKPTTPPGPTSSTEDPAATQNAEADRLQTKLTAKRNELNGIRSQIVAVQNQILGQIDQLHSLEDEANRPTGLIRINKPKIEELKTKAAEGKKIQASLIKQAANAEQAAALIQEVLDSATDLLNKANQKEDCQSAKRLINLAATKVLSLEIMNSGAVADSERLLQMVELAEMVRGMHAEASSSLAQVRARESEVDTAVAQFTQLVNQREELKQKLTAGRDAAQAQCETILGGLPLVSLARKTSLRGILASISLPTYQTTIQPVSAKVYKINFTNALKALEKEIQELAGIIASAQGLTTADDSVATISAATLMAQKNAEGIGDLNGRVATCLAQTSQASVSNQPSTTASTTSTTGTSPNEPPPGNPPTIPPTNAAPAAPATAQNPPTQPTTPTAPGGGETTYFAYTCQNCGYQWGGSSTTPEFTKDCPKCRVVMTNATPPFGTGGAATTYFAYTCGNCGYQWGGMSTTPEVTKDCPKCRTKMTNTASTGTSGGGGTSSSGGTGSGSGYNPSGDKPDTTGGDGSEVAGAKERLNAGNNLRNPSDEGGLAGDDGGGEVEVAYAGGNAAGEEEETRTEWGERTPDYQGREDSNPNTGEVKDPFGAAQETTEQIDSTVKGGKNIKDNWEQLTGGGKKGEDHPHPPGSGGDGWDTGDSKNPPSTGGGGKSYDYKMICANCCYVWHQSTESPSSDSPGNCPNCGASGGEQHYECITPGDGWYGDSGGADVSHCAGTETTTKPTASSSSPSSDTDKEPDAPAVHKEQSNANGNLKCSFDYDGKGKITVRGWWAGGATDKPVQLEMAVFESLIDSGVVPSAFPEHGESQVVHTEDKGYPLSASSANNTEYSVDLRVEPWAGDNVGNFVFHFSGD